MSASLAEQKTDSTGGYPPPGRSELHWPPQLVIALAVALQALQPERLQPIQDVRWVIPALEGLLLLTLLVSSPFRLEHRHVWRRRLLVMVTGLASAANAVSLGLLCHYLFKHTVNNGHELIIGGILIWLTNVLIFSLWYWEMDRGGPGTRAAGLDEPPDFLFPQMTEQRLCPDWRPQFADYLYVSLTNATAVSPTDTMPLSITAKMLMGLQSLISLVTIGLVIARAVNIL